MKKIQLILISKKIYKITNLLIKSVNELCGGYYIPSKTTMLYEKSTGKQYDMNLNAKENNIKNGTYKYLFKRNDEEENDTILDLKNNCNAKILDINMMNTQADANSTYLSIMNEFVTDLRNATS